MHTLACMIDVVQGMVLYNAVCSSCCIACCFTSADSHGGRKGATFTKNVLLYHQCGTVWLYQSNGIKEGHSNSFNIQVSICGFIHHTFEVSAHMLANHKLSSNLVDEFVAGLPRSDWPSSSSLSLPTRHHPPTPPTTHHHWCWHLLLNFSCTVYIYRKSSLIITLPVCWYTHKRQPWISKQTIMRSVWSMLYLGHLPLLLSVHSVNNIIMEM